MATIRKRNNSYQIRVSLGYDGNNCQIEKSTTWKPKPGMTEKQIQKELERQKVLFEEKCRTGQFLDSNITFSEFSERWFEEYAERYLSHRTVKRYKDLMVRILPAIGHIKLCQLQPQHLLRFYNNLGEDGIRLDIKYKPCKNFKALLMKSGFTQKQLSEQSGVSLTTIRSCINGNNITQKSAEKISRVIQIANLFTPAEGKTKLEDKTIAEHHRLISSILSTAVRWQVLFSNPCARTDSPKVRRKEALALDHEEAIELIKCLEAAPIKYRTAVMMCLYTGFRRSELCGLEWSDINLNQGIIKVTKTSLYEPDVGIYKGNTKTYTSNRTIIIPPDMIELLKQYQAAQQDKKKLLGDQWQNSKKIFTAENGSDINPDTLSNWFKRFIHRNNLPNIHLHSLRHTMATLLINEGVDIVTVSNRLGHSNKSTTLNTYAHAIKSADRAAANVMQDILNNARNSKIG